MESWIWDPRSQRRTMDSVLVTILKNNDLQKYKAILKEKKYLTTFKLSLITECDQHHLIHELGIEPRDQFKFKLMLAQIRKFQPRIESSFNTTATPIIKHQPSHHPIIHTLSATPPSNTAPRESTVAFVISDILPLPNTTPPFLNQSIRRNGYNEDFNLNVPTISPQPMNNIQNHNAFHTTTDIKRQNRTKKRRIPHLYDADTESITSISDDDDCSDDTEYIPDFFVPTPRKRYKTRAFIARQKQRRHQ
eukprot:621460_1